MPSLFQAYKAIATKVPTYFIESTAPDNVDDEPTSPSAIDGLAPIDPDQAIDEIARHLSGADEPNLVVMVHGFNNPQPAVLKMYAGSSQAIEADPLVSDKKGLVCVGYRWPSENMGRPVQGTFAALPALPVWLLVFGVILLVPYPLWSLLLGYGRWVLVGHFLTMLGLTLISTVAGIALLRVIVYFRDNYRAASFGAPDLVEIVRQIDRAVIDHDGRRLGLERSTALKHRGTNRVQLSFIGHSMGGFVVTNAIRVLSDLFAPDAVRTHLNETVVHAAPANAEGVAGSTVEKISPNIGNIFTLMRFVLASPDIPAEALLSNRANFLASSLRRFREAYLFSNEGDEVLRLISTAANYFSFPTKSWKFGYRLGNVEILTEDYGLIKPSGQSIPQLLRVGYYTVQELYEVLLTARREQAGSASLQKNLAEIISYFDCTDYVDIDSEGKRRPLLTFAKKIKQRNAKARMSWWSNFALLLAYLLLRQRPNVHGGYFEGQLSQKLIYRLSCLGFNKTVPDTQALAALSDECKDKQIRMLLSPALLAKAAAAHHIREHARHT